MERKIGEIFEYNGEWYQTLPERRICDDCAFKNDRTCKNSKGIRGECQRVNRQKDSVIFKKLEKVGEPFTGKVHIQFQRYKIYTEPIINSAENIGYAENTGYIDEGNTVAIEIKQNKEDMGEKKIQHYDCFFDGKSSKSNLKPFDLKAAKAGKPVCTRDGRKARIICFDRISNDGYKIVACVTAFDGDFEEVLFYGIDGYIVDSQNPKGCDLMMSLKKKEGWVNIYDDMRIYANEEGAKMGISPERTYITTTKIEWEE